MSAIPLYREANEKGEKERFFVPQFQVKVAGSPLKDEVVRDVMVASYRDSVEEIDSFELLINNWDASRQQFKYEPASQPDFQGLFEPGRKIELAMGYRDNMRLMLVGEITTLEPNFPESGPPTLAVRGLNVLHSLRRKQHTWSWENKRDSDIARELGSQPAADDRPGLGLAVRVSDEAAGREQPEEFVFMNNQYDILFLLERARRRGYSVYLALDGESGEQYLYFGPTETLREVTYELEWGKTLTQFRPTLTTVNQVAEVVVRGWNRRTRKPIEGKASIDERDIKLPRDPAVAAAVKGRREVVTDRPVYTKAEADALARKILREQLQEQVRGAGVTVGLPDLRAGRRLRIRKLGKRFDGEYFVTDTSHAIGDGGYRTTFGARREKELEG